MVDEDYLVGAVRNGSTIELYADFGRVAKLLIPVITMFLVGASVVARLIAGSIWHISVPALCGLLLVLMIPLLLAWRRHKPLFLLTPEGVVENLPGGIKIRWSEIEKVDSLVAWDGTLVRLFLRDWRAFIARFGWFQRQAMRLMRWVLGSSYAPVTFDPAHFGTTEAELAGLLKDFIPSHAFVATPSHESTGDIFWRAVRVVEPVFPITVVGAGILILAARPFGFLAAASWSKFLGCVALVFVGFHVVFYALLFTALAIHFVLSRRCSIARPANLGGRK